MIIDLGYGIKDLLADCALTRSAYGLNNILISKSKNVWNDSVEEYSIHITNGKLILSVPIQLDLDNQYELEFLGNSFDSQGRLINGCLIHELIKSVNNGCIEFIFNENNILSIVKSKRKEIRTTIEYNQINPTYSRFPNLYDAVCSSKNNPCKDDSSVNQIAISPFLLQYISNSFGNPTGLKMEFTGNNSAIFIKPNHTNTNDNPLVYDKRLKALLMPLAI